MSTSLPRIFTCSDAINNVDYVDINYGTLGLINIPAITASASVDVNVFISNKTKTTARINFSQKFIGTLYYTVIGFN
tara:strand:+ start:25393 stop:25623 length:231 start_codon:yes stop_codon:yes gene_type:complete